MPVIQGQQVHIFQLLSIKSAMELEQKGMKHSSGKSAHSLAKRILGISGSREKVYAEFCKYLDEVKKGSLT